MRRIPRSTIIFTAVAIGAMCNFATAQSQPIVPMGEMQHRHIDSGERANFGMMPQTAYADVVATDNALWKRLYFSEVTLEGDSRIRFTSLLDGAVQELDADGIAMWSNSSAYFNGNAVMIELIAAPGTQNNRFVLEAVGVELGTQPISDHCSSPLQCGLCNGEDNRVPSNELWAPRLISGGGGCSAAIYNTQSCVVSAGHCMGSNMVIQFNVPLSNPNCSINHPPVEDQFPVIDQISENSGVGGDWAVMTSGTNNLGETAYERYGEYRPIAPSVPSSGPADVWGYGVTDDCIFRQTQQHSMGQILGLGSNTISYTSETTCGNSGSSVLQNDMIIGIATHCTFNCPPQGNTANRIDAAAFINARNQLCPDIVDPVDVEVPADYATIQAAINDVPIDSTITVAPGTYNEAINFIGKNITVVSSGGPDVTIIDASGTGASVVRFTGSEGSDAILDGFTLTGGTGSDVNISGTSYVLGGGIYADPDATPTVSNCVITGNTAQFGGGVFNNNASPTFDNCIIADNSSTSSGGGGFNFSGATPTFNNVQFTGNTAGGNGGGMSNQNASPTVTNSTFIDNEASGNGGAVRNIQGSAGTFTGSTFELNSAGGAGGAFYNEDSSSTAIGSSSFCENSPSHIAGSFNNMGGNEFEDLCEDPCPQAGDLNCDGVVDGQDLLILLSGWGDCSDPNDCPADLNGDGVVDGQDLLILLSNWG